MRGWLGWMKAPSPSAGKTAPIKTAPAADPAGRGVHAPLSAPCITQGIALHPLLRLLPSHRQSLPIARATSFGKTFGPGSAGSRLGFQTRGPPRAVGSPLSQVRPAHEAASLDKSLPDESRATPSKTGSTFNSFGRMNAALLEKTSIRGGTSFCWVTTVGCVAHLNELSTPAPFPFPRSHQPLKLLSRSSAPPLPMFRGQKGAFSFPPQNVPPTQVP